MAECSLACVCSQWKAWGDRVRAKCAQFKLCAAWYEALFTDSAAGTKQIDLAIIIIVDYLQVVWLKDKVVALTSCGTIFRDGFVLDKADSAQGERWLWKYLNETFPS